MHLCQKLKLHVRNIHDTNNKKCRIILHTVNIQNLVREWVRGDKICTGGGDASVSGSISLGKVRGLPRSLLVSNLFALTCRRMGANLCIEIIFFQKRTRWNWRELMPWDFEKANLEYLDFFLFPTEWSACHFLKFLTGITKSTLSQIDFLFR